MFHKVVWQHIQVEVGFLINNLLHIYQGIVQWKNLENRFLTELWSCVCGLTFGTPCGCPRGAKSQGSKMFTRLFYYSPPCRETEYYDERVCLCACEHISRTTRQIFTKFCCMRPMNALRCSDGVTIRYILPVLWMTSYLHTMARNRWHEILSGLIGGSRITTNTLNWLTRGAKEYFTVFFISQLLVHLSPS